jgi:oligopeptide transport system permease protein
MIPRIGRKGLAGVVCAAIVLAPSFLPLESPDHADPSRRSVRPLDAGATSTPLGTDDVGRCILSRTLHGARISMIAALVGGAVSLSIGVAVGLLAGWKGGAVESRLMRAVDAADALPSVVVVILAQAWIRSAGGPLGGKDARTAALFAVLGFATWFVTARLVRSKTASLRRAAFVEAALASGAPASSVVLRHVLPNLRDLVAACAAVTIPRLVLFEAFLSFLGLGVEAPRVSLGSLARTGFDAFAAVDPRWTPLLAPCVALAAVSFATGALAERDSAASRFAPT